jgi:Flp pilus assembly protein TadG
MLDTTIFNRVRAATCRFAGANQGNIAVLFAIAAVPIISFVGAAIDYSRVNAARTAMQGALDSTALMLGKDLTDGTIPPSQLTTKATAYFTALYTNVDARNVAVNATYTVASGATPATILITGNGTVNTDFMRVAGFPNLNFSTTSTSTWGNVRMRVAMALDNTGSMADDGKMPAMQTAAKALIDQLKALSKTNGDVYISIIPFAKDVNVGASNYNQTWVDFTAWDKLNGKCSKTSYTTQSACVNAGKTWTPANHNTWNGCVWDRDKDTVPPGYLSPSGYDSVNAAPVASNAATLFQAEQWSSCPVALMPLSYDWTALKSLIGTMTPNGNTNQAIGMAWAWQSLASIAPLNAPEKEAAYTYKDAIILLSDGLNTQDRWYSDATSIDKRQKALCDNAKKAGVVVYTIQVNTGTPGDPTSTVLQNCASSPENFYLVKSASQTLTVFNSIGTSLSKLRVAR